MDKTPLHKIGEMLAPIHHFVCRASFESRSVSIANIFSTDRLRPMETTVLVGSQRGELAKKHAQQLKALLHPRIEQLEMTRPSQTADVLLALSKQICSSSKKTVIDVTTFRREELLILLRMLVNHFTPSTDCELLYLEAGDMAGEWLSRDTVGYRSVVGYAGDMAPSKRIHLIVMLGFELQRARDLIDNYEPSRMSVGYGRRTESITAAFHQRNVDFFKSLKSWYGADLNEFEFSLTNPLTAQKDLARVVAGTSNVNTVLAPMNNKISTIGAGLAAIEDTSIQICYSIVSQYNEEQYSTPGKNVYYTSLRHLVRATTSPSQER